jgi:hypothetical protein
MSISSEVRRAGPYSGNGSTVAFAFAFKVFSTSQVVVTRTVSSVETVLTLTTHYTVALNSNQNTNPGGTVTMLSAPTTGQSITITSNVANLQPTAIANLGGFYPEVINDSLDRATIQIQQLDERVDRALVIPVSSSGISTQLPVPQSSKLIGWDSAGTALQNYNNVPVGSTVYQYVHRTIATAGQTAVALPITYTVGAMALSVFVNGLRVEQGSGLDYVETNNQTITFTSGLSAGDLVVVAIHGDIDAAATPPNYTIESIAALRLLTGTTTATQLLLLWNHVAGDGGGTFRYDSTDTTTADNGGTIIVDAAGRRWKRQYSGALKISWFAALSNALTAAGSFGVLIIDRSLVVNSAPTIADGITIVVMPDVTVSGSQANSLLRPSSGKIINLGFTDTAFPPPSGTDKGLFLQFAETFDNLTINKYVSGTTTSTASDGRFPTVTLQHFNDMTRTNVGDWYYVNGAFLYGRSYWGLNSPARGSSLAIWGEIYAFDNADFATGNTGGEPAAYHGTAKPHWDTSLYDNGHINLWGFDLNVGGPNYGATSANREGLLICYSGTVNKLTSGNTIDLTNGNAQKRGSYGGAMQTAPGIGLLPYIGTDSWVGKITYPVRIGYAINGFTGPYDGANIASDGHDADATNGYDVGLQIGGWGGAWPDVRFSPNLAYNSKIGTGIYVLDHVNYGVRIGARHPGGTAPSVQVDRGAGALVLDEEVRTKSIKSADSSSYVNFMEFLGSATGGYNRIIARGSDANVGFTIETKGTAQAALNANGSANQFNWSSTGIGFLGTNPVAKQTVTGSRGGNAALESLIDALEAYGLIVDSST